MVTAALLVSATAMAKQLAPNAQGFGLTSFSEADKIFQTLKKMKGGLAE
jgi:hypothetical protein